MFRLQVLSRQLCAAADGNAGAEAELERQPTSAAGGAARERRLEDREPYITTEDQYHALYERSITDPSGFWSEMAKEYYWQTPFVKDHCAWNYDIRNGPINIQFFKGGRTNISYNCLDRWVEAGRGNQLCLIWEGNDYGHERTMTYSAVLAEVCRLANWLKAQGVRKGDAVTLYLPMICELPIAMLACARIGAMHSVVFAGFSAEAMAQRIMDSKSKVVITASGVMRGTKSVALKEIVDQAVKFSEQGGHKVPTVLVWEKAAVPREKCPWTPGRDVWWREAIPRMADRCPPEWVASEDPLFLLYTSGSTGKPKGVMHTTGGFMVNAGATCKYALDIRPGDVYWCTADCGWITGHTYITYGPLLRGATALLFGSTPSYPDAGRCWKVVERYKVRQFYTAPTLLRSLLQLGDEWVHAHDRSSLRLLGSVGEPLNVHAWHWFNDVVGEGHCPIIDTWWQTETGSSMIQPFPGRWCKPKPGSACLPFFGVQVVVLDPATGRELEGPCEGVLAIKAPHPGMSRTLFGDHPRFEATYFAPFKGYYFTGDGCRRDADGHYWITGRVDDVINVSGHRIGTAEVESALTEHDDCAEAAVIGIDHPVKGQAIYAYVTLVEGKPHTEAMKRVLAAHVRQAIGPFAAPDVIHWAPALPKTRSGKIMRRVLRKIAAHEEKELGDVSTLADPGVVQMLIGLRGK